MKKKGILSLIVLIVLYFFWNQRYVQFFQVEFNSKEYVVIENTPSEDFYNNLKTVLNYYGEDFKEENNLVWIKQSLFNDKELCYNYTNKAKDSTWISSKKDKK